MLLPQLLGEDLAAAAVAAQHKGGIVIFLIEREVRGRRIQIAAVGRQLLGRDIHEQRRLQALRVARGEERVEERRAVPGHAAAQLLPVCGKIAQLAAQQAGLQQAVEHHAQLLLRALRAAAQVAVVAEEHQRLGGQVVRGAGELRIDEGLIAVGRREGKAAPQRVGVGLQRAHQSLVRRFAAALAGQQAVQLPRQPLDAAGVQGRQRLGHGQDDELVGIFDAPLRDGVKIAHGVDLVAEEFQTHRALLCRGEDVHDAAAHAELARALHEGAAGVARVQQAGDQLVQFELRAGQQAHRGGEQLRLRHRPQGKRLERRQEQGRFAARQIVKAAQALLLPAARDGGGVIKHQVARRQDRGLRAEEGGKLTLRAPCGHFILADDHGGPGRVAAEGRDEMGTVDLRRAGYADSLRALQRGPQAGIIGQPPQKIEDQFHDTPPEKGISSMSKCGKQEFSHFPSEFRI